MARTLAIATRMTSETLKQLKRIFPKETPSAILRIIVEERIAVQRNTESLFAARKTLGGKKSDRSLL